MFFVYTKLDGRKYSRATAFVIDAKNPADYTDLFDELGERGFHPTTIAHLWGFDPHLRTSLEALDRVQETGFYSLLFLAQALAARTGPQETMRMGVVTREMQDVLGGDLSQPEKATVLGSCKAIASEIGGIDCVSIDVDATPQFANLGGRFHEWHLLGFNSF